MNPPKEPTTPAPPPEFNAFLKKVFGYRPSQAKKPPLVATTHWGLVLSTDLEATLT